MDYYLNWWGTCSELKVGWEIECRYIFIWGALQRENMFKMPEKIALDMKKSRKMEKLGVMRGIAVH